VALLFFNLKSKKMALTVALELVFSSTTVILNDITGAYHAVDNPTGYGTPNAEFADYAHFAMIRKKNVNNVADSLLALAVYDEITATEFIGTRSVDGWYEGCKLNIPIWTAGTYASGTVKFYNGVIYKANTSTSEQPPHADWDVITDLEDIEGNSSIITTYEGRVTAYNGDVYWSKQIALNSQAGHCGLCEDDKKKARLDKIYRYIQNVLVADQLGDNQNGEWNALQLIAMGAV
jgi:hypothetical protein